MASSSDELYIIDQGLERYDEYLAAKQYIVDLLQELIFDTEGVHNDTWVSGIKYALQRVVDFG